MEKICNGEERDSTHKMISNPSTHLYLEEVQEQIDLTKLHVIVLVSCALGYYAVCVEMMMFIFMYSPLVDTWQISGLDYATYQALGTACSFVAGLSCGRWADRHGRRGPYLFGITMAWVAGFASAFSNSFWLYLGFRCLVSAGLAAISVVNFVIVSEFFPPKHRSRSLVVVSTFGTLGVLSCAGVAWGILSNGSDDWRLFVALVSMPLFLSGLLHFFFVPPETAKYLMLKEKWDDVFHVLCVFAASGPVFPRKDDSPTPQPPLPLCSVCQRQRAFFYSSSSLSLGENEYQTHTAGLPLRSWIFQTKNSDFFCHCGMEEGFRKASILDEGKQVFPNDDQLPNDNNNSNPKFYSLEDPVNNEGIREREEESSKLLTVDKDYLTEETGWGGEEEDGRMGETERCWGNTWWLFRGDKRSVTTVLSFLWLLQAMAFWGFSSFLPKFYDEIGLNLYPQMFLMVGMELPAYALGLVLVKKEYLGVINCLCLYFALTFVSLILLGLGSYVGSKWMAVVFSTTSFMFLVPNYAFLYTYSPTQYPTSLRSTAMGFLNGVAAFPGFFTPFIGFALTSLPPSETYIYPLAWSVCVFIAFGLSFFLKYLK